MCYHTHAHVGKKKSVFNPFIFRTLSILSQSIEIFCLLKYVNFFFFSLDMVVSQRDHSEYNITVLPDLA